MSDPIVYRSGDPQVLQAWITAQAGINAYIDQTRAVLDQAGLSGCTVLRNTAGWHPGRFAGLAIPDGEQPPAGWRLNKPCTFATPDKRMKAGKRIDAELNAVRHPGDPRHKLIGMPPDMLTGPGFTSPAVRLLEARTALYVIWPEEPEGRESFFAGKVTIDHDLWQHVKLSDYYREVEDAEETAKAAGEAVTA